MVFGARHMPTSCKASFSKLVGRSFQHHHLQKHVLPSRRFDNLCIRGGLVCISRWKSSQPKAIQHALDEQARDAVGENFLDLALDNFAVCGGSILHQNDLKKVLLMLHLPEELANTNKEMSVVCNESLPALDVAVSPRGVGIDEFLHSHESLQPCPESLQPSAATDSGEQCFATGRSECMDKDEVIENMWLHKDPSDLDDFDDFLQHFEGLGWLSVMHEHAQVCETQELVQNVHALRA